jgi:signal transduction histidine kinase
MKENKKGNKREDFSIVFKLNTWHLSQVFFGFLLIDILLIILFSGALVCYAERDIGQRVENSAVGDLLTEQEPDGFHLPGFLNRWLPDHMEGVIRQFVVPSGESSFWKRLDDVTYRAWVPFSGGRMYYAADYAIGRHLTLFLKLFLVLTVFELLFLLGGIGKGARAVRRSLQPLSDLARTAKSINQTRMVRPDIQLRDLTGTIDTINVTRLDRRVSIRSEQRELKDLAGAINGMLDRIDASYRSQVRFVSDASHELRTPISVIQGYANLLDRWGKKDEKALQESIDAIKGEAESMKDLVEQLLFLARGDNDSMKLNREPVNLSRIAEEVVRETAMIDPNHEYVTKTEKEVYTIGDAQLIKQAFRIFVDNSTKYTPPGGTITVSAARKGDSAKVTVQDNGIGIPSKDLSHIFDRFFRSDDSRARKTGGTGLGLSISKWIIDRHHAVVEVLSRKDLGTRITISFPAGRTAE